MDFSRSIYSVYILHIYICILYIYSVYMYIYIFCTYCVYCICMFLFLESSLLTQFQSIQVHLALELRRLLLPL